MKLLLWLLCLPLILASKIIETLAPSDMISDLHRCIFVANKYGESVPINFVQALIVAEDHRSNLHPGIDPIAIFRALWVKLSRGDVQGASTIEQQFVRVISGRYERTVGRKLREQVLALMVARRFGKRQIASAYLCVAFFGSGSVGLSGLQSCFGNDLSIVSFEQALLTVAQLKYPRPLSPTSEWNEIVKIRFLLLLSDSEDRGAGQELQKPGQALNKRPSQAPSASFPV